jgi:hypothetical protein
MYKPCDGHIQKSHVGDNMTTGPGRAEIPLGVICVSISGVRYKTKSQAFAWLFVYGCIVVYTF